jgi:hypothetical protein
MYSTGTIVGRFYGHHPLLCCFSHELLYAVRIRILVGLLLALLFLRIYFRLTTRFESQRLPDTLSRPSCRSQ